MSENQDNIDKQFSRRDFVKLGAAAGLGAALISSCTSSKGLTAAAASSTKVLTSPPGEFVADPIETVRMGFVGVGSQGSVHVRNFLSLEGVEIKALCDIVEERAKRNQERVVQAGQPAPELYTRGETDFKRLCERGDIDLVFTATPWEWHVPVLVAAMEAGKHAATEVPAAITLDECWQMVETSERTRKYCIMMENCVYDRFELMTLNLVRQGLLGEILHAENGYLHDLRGVKFNENYEGRWRRAHSIARNGNLYPTHGLFPAAQCMNINRGDQFDYLVSMSSPSRGLQLYQQEHLEPDDPRRNETYKLGDVNSSLIKTKLGKTIIVIHDTNLPRPYTRIDLVQGTRGIVRKYPEPLVHIEGKSRGHNWDKAEVWYEEYEHPLWKAIGGRGAGHGGMDFIEDYRLIKCLREGLPTDMDVYDAAAISAVIELSEISVANRGRSMDFPDFTRGAWKTRPPLGIVGA